MSNQSKFPFEPLSKKPTNSTYVRDWAPATKAPEEIFYSEEDMAAAREEGRKQGFEEGKQEGIRIGQGERLEQDKHQAELDKKLITLAGVIEQKIVKINTQHAEERALRERECTKIAAAIARKIAGELIDAHMQTRIEHYVSQCLELMLDEKEILVSVHSSMLEGMKASLSRLSIDAGFKGKLTLQPNDKLAASDCLVEWHNGGAKLDTERLWREVSGVLATEIPAPQPAAPHAAPEAAAPAKPEAAATAASTPSEPSAG